MIYRFSGEFAEDLAGEDKFLLGGNAETMAWALLQDKYATRLDVPQDEWTKLVADIPDALLMAFLLIFIARPAAVFLSLAFEKFTWREKLFISWVGLRGAIPIYLAIFPVMMGVPGNFFNIAFLVVLVSLVLQSTTVGLVARWLGIGAKAGEEAPANTASQPL